ncbi:MAG: hypothetical protein A4S09_16535 [Proteobacteria bacterium SG_bin7]|nr:MAG: hypothetical protein A4S09_16535 [Proteobacteria bacterium SG_bin7]
MKSRGLYPTLKRIAPYTLRYRLLFSSIVVFVLLYSIIARTLPWIVGYTIDNGIVKSDFDIVWKLAIAYMVTQTLASALLYVQSILFQRLGNRALFDIREDLISHVQALPIKFFDENSSGKIITRVTNDVSSLGNFFNQVLFSLTNATIETISIIIALSFVSVRLTFVTLIAAPAIAFLSIKITHRIREVFHAQKQKLSAINAFVAENISGIAVLRLYNRIGANQKKFQRLSLEYKTESLKMSFNYALLWPLLAFFNASCILLTLLYGGYLTSQEVIAIGSLVTFILNVQDLQDPLSNLLEKYVQLQDSLASADRIFDLLDEKKEDLTGKLITNSRGEITFKNLSFRYARTGPLVLDGINLKIKPGENIGVVGKTGSGKSTLISLLQKFYSVTDGEILVDHQPLSRISARDWRAKIGIIQQDPFIFRGTVASNIALNTNSLSRGRIEQAALLSHCTDIFSKRKGGIDAIVEEKGANLSAGEKQLIAFARIFAFEPSILILDEATANIDSHTESLIQNAIKKVSQSRTCIIIAHRLSTLHFCDRIVVLDDHKIAEVGSHEELMNLKGQYYDLYCQHYLKPNVDYIALMQS